ncbi:MAG TPA: IS110 family transposase [Beijerinckiaceae bacterium]
MHQITTIGLDLAKHVFQVHAVDASGTVVLRRSLRRGQVEGFFGRLPPCLVGMEACGTAHHWARVLSGLGHEVRLIPPAYVKAYVRRNKTDAADAEAICEALGRRGMRFVPVRTTEEQAAASQHRVRELLVRQRTMLTNALRAHLSEFGLVAAKGPANLKGLMATVEDPADARLPALLREALAAMARALEAIEAELQSLDAQVLAVHKASETSRRLATIPGFGPIVASAMAARITNPERFASGRDFAAYLGLAPKQHASGGKVRLGGISKRGDAYLRRLLVNGAMAIITSRRGKADPWLASLLAKKPRLVAAVALANKMARIAFAVMVHKTEFRDRPAAA